MDLPDTSAHSESKRCFSPRAIFSIGLWACLALSVLNGCWRRSKLPDLPDSELIRSGQLIVHSDVDLDSQQRLLEALTRLRNDVFETLALPAESGDIHVYLFEDHEQFSGYLAASHPTLPDRRAFFMKDRDQLKVFGFWGDRVAEDLRHEVTHGYLHSALNDVPLWMDEGIAEYFEVTNSFRGLNVDHIALLVSRLEQGSWTPNLQRLESYTSSAEMLQIDYAESWLWIHWMLEGEQTMKEELRDYLSSLHSDGVARPMSTRVGGLTAAGGQLLDHLRAMEKFVSQ